MNIKQYNKDQTVNWEYLPDITTLLRYFERKELIELSKSCKRHRNQLEKRVFENLSLDAWCYDNWDIYYELKISRNYKKILKYMKTDLGRKIKFARKFTLGTKINYPFAKKFVKLFPNILTLELYENCQSSYFSERSLITVLKGMEHLEHVILNEFWVSIDEYRSKAQIFPKSLKSFKIYTEWDITCYDDKLMIYDTIDSSYKNLISLTIGSNRMLQNLSSGMPNLKELEIGENFCWNNTKLVEFLKANPQLKKLNIYLNCYNQEIINIILSYKYLERWHIIYDDLNEIEINNFPSNCIIKYLKIDSCQIPASLLMKIVKACKNVKTLEIMNHRHLKTLDWSKFKRRINILKLSYTSLSPNDIKEIDISRIFNQVHFKQHTFEKPIEEYDIGKLMNYKLISSRSKYCTLKLINKDIKSYNTICFQIIL
jgi:hypothetical protein